MTYNKKGEREAKPLQQVKNLSTLKGKLTLWQNQTPFHNSTSH